jgi:hypothetical protein
MLPAMPAALTPIRNIPAPPLQFARRVVVLAARGQHPGQSVELDASRHAVARAISNSFLFRSIVMHLLQS